MTLVFMFPGQSSRYPGMLDKLAQLHPHCAAIVEAASERTSRDLLSHFSADNPTAFDRNVDVQVGVFLANHLFLTALEAHGIEAEMSLGLSLGEYNHLVHIGALSFEHALDTVVARGRAYDEGPRGWMASIQPIDTHELEEVVLKITRESPELGSLEIVNFNSPQQHVLAGTQEAVEHAVGVLEDEHFVQAVIIERQVPMHSSMFRSVGERFRRTLEHVSFSTPSLPWLPNRLGRVFHNPSPSDFVELLATHVHEPVLWRRSIDHVLSLHPDAVFVEVGPMSVLHNLLHRKWTRAERHRSDSLENTAGHLGQLVAQLHAHGAAAREVGWTAS